MSTSIDSSKVPQHQIAAQPAVQKTGKPSQTKTATKASRCCVFWIPQEPLTEKPTPRLRRLTPPDPTADPSPASEKDFRKRHFIRNDKVE